MKCLKCGKEIANDSNFCEYCGERVRHSYSNKTIWIAVFVCFALSLFISIILFQQASRVYSYEYPEVVDSIEVESIIVDLGLPSRTLWCIANELGYYTYDDAVKKFGKSLPSEEQMRELAKKCKWIWNEKGYYKVIGPNGKSIILPADGYISKSFNPEKSVTDKGYLGYYWSRTEDFGDYAVALCFDSRGYSVDGGLNRKHGFSVRLVK